VAQVDGRFWYDRRDVFTLVDCWYELLWHVYVGDWGLWASFGRECNVGRWLLW
jgi:hypothetical protein